MPFQRLNRLGAYVVDYIGNGFAALRAKTTTRLQVEQGHLVVEEYELTTQPNPLTNVQEPASTQPNPLRRQSDDNRTLVNPENQSQHGHRPAAAQDAQAERRRSRGTAIMWTSIILVLLFGLAGYVWYFGWEFDSDDGEDDGMTRMMEPMGLEIM
jgi:hypothetical protein